MRSTAARSSSSEIRTNSPSTTMSLTVSRQPPWTPPQRGECEERRGLHLDGEDAALRPALVLAPVRVVEEVARDDRPHAERLVRVLGDVHGLVDELPARRRAVRLAADEMRGGRVRRHGRDRDDEVAERVVGLEPAAGADAEEPLHPELDQLLEDDGRARAAHPGPLHRDRLTLPTSRVPEQTALGVHLRRHRKGTSRRCTSHASGSPGSRHASA